MKFLILSAHDYRSRRKAGIHFVTAELQKIGKVRFFSCQYSMLSQLKSDPRASIDQLANKKAIHEGVECYLWKTLIHPFNVRKPAFRFIENLLFARYINQPSPVLTEWIKDSDVILFESGIAPIFFDLVKRLNPGATTIYVASDDLATINVAAYVADTFNRVAPQMTALCLKSRFMADNMPPSANKFVIPHGFDFSAADHADPSPYSKGRHAVSVGSMLFDPAFFVVASREFPDVTFHLIGSGTGVHPGYGSNVQVHDEMPHKLTLPYIKHATFGIAPYRSANMPRYLSDTSLKLMQYDFFKLPAVCPSSVVGDHQSRFGYTPGNATSIIAAINAAITAPRISSRTPLQWSEAVARMLNPEEYSDTCLVQAKADPAHTEG
jgi:2-beta-glucuronyltransferase